MNTSENTANPLQRGVRARAALPRGRAHGGGVVPAREVAVAKTARRIDLHRRSVRCSSGLVRGDYRLFAVDGSADSHLPEAQVSGAPAAMCAASRGSRTTADELEQPAASEAINGGRHQDWRGLAAGVSVSSPVGYGLRAGTRARSGRKLGSVSGSVRGPGRLVEGRYAGWRQRR